jgi:hypothetical protein
MKQEIDFVTFGYSSDFSDAVQFERAVNGWLNLDEALAGRAYCIAYARADHESFINSVNALQSTSPELFEKIKTKVTNDLIGKDNNILPKGITIGGTQKGKLLTIKQQSPVMLEKIELLGTIPDKVSKIRDENWKNELTDLSERSLDDVKAKITAIDAAIVEQRDVSGLLAHVKRDLLNVKDTEKAKAFENAPKVRLSEVQNTHNAIKDYLKDEAEKARLQAELEKTEQRAKLAEGLVNSSPEPEVKQPEPAKVEGKTEPAKVEPAKPETTFSREPDSKETNKLPHNPILSRDTVTKCKGILAELIKGGLSDAELLCLHQEMGKYLDAKMENGLGDPVLKQA